MPKKETDEEYDARLQYEEDVREGRIVPQRPSLEPGPVEPHQVGDGLSRLESRLWNNPTASEMLYWLDRWGDRLTDREVFALAARWGFLDIGSQHQFPTTAEIGAAVGHIKDPTKPLTAGAAAQLLIRAFWKLRRSADNQPWERPFRPIRVRFVQEKTEMEIPKATPPAQKQLHRLGVFAQVAWGEEREIRFGFNLTKAGVRIYVKQVGGKNSIDQTGDTADGVVAAMEEFFCIIGAHNVSQHTKVPTTPEKIREIVEKIIADASGRPIDSLLRPA